MLRHDVEPLQIDLVGVHRAISVEGSPCGGELGASQINVLRRRPLGPRFGSIDRLIFVACFGVVYRLRRTGDHPARHRDLLALCEAAWPEQAQLSN
jgi:hypothetical protein